jgi:hypothetical protein
MSLTVEGSYRAELRCLQVVDAVNNLPTSWIRKKVSALSNQCRKGRQFLIPAPKSEWRTGSAGMTRKPKYELIRTSGAEKFIRE